MTEARLNLQRAILWQAGVILLPILLLVGVGFYVLKQDQAAVTEAARQRAAEITHDLSDRLGRQIASELSSFERTGNLWAGDGIIGGLVPWPGRSPLTAENVTAYHNSLSEWQTNYPALRPADVFPIHASFTETGEIDSPKQYPIPPTPVPWLAELSAEQQSFWREITRCHDLPLNCR